MTRMDGMIALNDNERYHYEQQIEHVIRGALFLTRVFPKWSLYVDTSMLGTFIPGSSIYEQMSKYVVFPPLSLEERTNLGFNALPEFLLTNSLEAIWATIIYCHRRELEKENVTDKLPTVTVSMMEEGE